jgi:hypothetical protein
MKILNKILIPVSALFLVIGCTKPQKYPNEPIISYKSFIQYTGSDGADSIGVLKLSFTDGNGDIGLNQEDTLPPFDKGGPYFYDFIIKYFEKQNGAYINVLDSLTGLTNNSRIPYLTPEGKNKALTGEIEMQLFINNPLSDYDTIRFEAFIYDRALNKSNTITTPDIILNKK